MAAKNVKFDVDVPQEVDLAVKKLAQVEGRPSKRNMHQTILCRLERLWKESPDELIRIGLIKPEGATAR